MGETELFISGMGISKQVLSTIVSNAAEKVEGVARVGGNDIASGLVSVFTSRSVSPSAAVESEVEDGKLRIVVHLALFYGYQFTKIAAQVRTAVAEALVEQTGASVSAVDVCIDSLVFPKE